MHLLRAEKGFIIVGQDTDGTMTPIDLQMDWIVSLRKNMILLVKDLLYRSDTMREDRKQLVGLITDNPKEVLRRRSTYNFRIKSKPCSNVGPCNIKLL